MYSVVLIDDQPAILAGLTAMVEGTGIARVTGSETDGDRGIETALEQRPDLVFLDVSLGKASGIDVARKLLERWPEARILAVSAHGDSVYVRGMFNAGANGYMLKDKGPGEVSRAITTIMEGGQWLSEGLTYAPA